jgi:hypothetical protein
MWRSEEIPRRPVCRQIGSCAAHLSSPLSSESVKSTDAGPCKVHKSTPPTCPPRARTNLCNARCRSRQCRRRRGFQQPRSRQHGSSDATTAQAAQRRMPVRVPLERDTLLCRGLGDSSRVAEQVRPREGGHLSQSSSSHTHTHSRHRASPLPPSLTRHIFHTQDSSCINLFQPYFWLVFDHPNVRKLLPEASAQINVQVVDLPRSDGNVGLEDMMRGLGLPASEPPPAPAENEASEDEDASDAPPGYKSLDVRVEWARTSLPFSCSLALIQE